MRKTQLPISSIKLKDMSNEKQNSIPVECKLIVKHYEKSETDFRTATDIKQHLETVTGQSLNAIQVGKALRMLKYPRVVKKVKGRAVHVYMVSETGEK